MLTTLIAVLASAQAATTVETQTLEIVANKGQPPRREEVLMLIPETRAEALPVLTCKNGEVGLLLVMDGRDPRDLWDDHLAKESSAQMQMRIDGKKAYEGRFTKLTRDLYMATEQKVAAKVYNAAIKGETVSIKSGREVTDVTLPAVDDGFREFAARCQRSA